MIRRPPRSTQSRSSAASDVYKRQGEIIERRSKKGKTFYGCNRYPDCTFVAWGKPVPEKCSECGSPYMVEKWLKAGAVWQCPNPECKHKVEAPVPVETLG